MGLKAAVQALKKAEELKAKVSQHNDLLNNSEVWSDQQQLQTVYHQVLVLDLEYALDKKVEQELWTLGFKNHIAILQHLSRDKKNSRRSECQALLSWCLEAASGFYLTLLQELCSTFELDIPFRRRSTVYGQTKPWPNSEQLMQPHKTSCLYICQYCLVHLGDIARYRSQRKQAESFYRHAILLSPSSGQPYNQLALLEASRGDRLATVFHYVRSISVKHPFPAAATNLANTLSALIDNIEPSVEIHHGKLSQSEFISIFLKVHSLFHSVTDLNQAEIYVKILNTTFTALVATQAFSSVKLIQMTAINMYALRNISDSLTNNQLTNDEFKVKHLIMELIAGALSAYLLPIYTMNENTMLLDYYALPAIKLTLDWININPMLLNDVVFTKRLQIWPSLCKLLNNLQSNTEDFSVSKYDKIPLPEDRDLQCFLPLMKAFKDLDFGADNLNQDPTLYNNLRIARLVNFGSWLCTQCVNNGVVMTCKKLSNAKHIFFEPENKQPDPTTELLEELKFFNIQESINISSADTTDTQNCKKLFKGMEKRGGILKPQGSLEKSREEREQALLLSSTENNNSSCNTSNINISTSRSDTLKSKRTRQNVAMQVLAKKVDEINKQVTFQTEPIVKTIEKPQLKVHEVNNFLSGIPKDTMKPKETVHSSVSSFIKPTCPKPHEINPNHTLPNANNAVNMPFAYNQNQNYQRLNINVGNVPFSVQYPNKSQSILYHNNLQQQNNCQYPRQPINLATSNISSPKSQTTGLFSVGFERNIAPVPTSSFQNVTASHLPQNESFKSWMHEEKLPMPPSTWWSNNQKPFPSQTYKQSYPININSVAPNKVNFMQDNLNGMDYNMQYNAGIGNTNGFSNMWNTPNIQPNIPILLNSSLLQSQPNLPPTCAEVNKSPSVVMDSVSQVPRESNDQANSMPGYSLFNSNWAPNLVHSALQSSSTDRSLMRQQSLFSGPGPSPLERLLEQQKQMRGSSKENS